MENSSWGPLIQDVLKQAMDSEAVPGGEPGTDTLSTAQPTDIAAQTREGDGAIFSDENLKKNISPRIDSDAEYETVMLNYLLRAIKEVDELKRENKRLKGEL
jgi:hypothetical protein